MKESLESLIAQHPEFKDRIEAAFPEFFPKVIEFLDAESKQPRDNYSGKKLFKIPKPLSLNFSQKKKNT